VAPTFSPSVPNEPRARPQRLPWWSDLSANPEKLAYYTGCTATLAALMQ
jgi:hypothetical protein